MISEMRSSHDAYVGLHVRFDEGGMGEQLSLTDGFDAARRVVDTIDALTLLTDALNKPPETASGLHEIAFSNVPLIVDNAIVGERRIGFLVSPARTKARVVINEQFNDPEDPLSRHAVTFGYVARHVGKRAFIKRLGKPVHTITAHENGEEYGVMHTLDAERDVPAPTGLRISTGVRISEIEHAAVTQFVKSDVQAKLFELEEEQRRATREVQG